DRFPLGQGHRQVRVEEADEVLVVRRLRLPEPARLLRSQVEFIEERAVALGRGAEAVEIKARAIRAQQEAVTTPGVARRHRRARIRVAILRGAVEEQFALIGRPARRDVPGADTTGEPPALRDDGMLVIAPDHAGDALAEAPVSRGRTG